MVSFENVFLKIYSSNDSDIEIDPEVDFDSRRAVYFRQMRYGLFVRINFCQVRMDIE
jgi:aspartate carbamoyltransferase catalytic subunit